jgi:DNA-binding NarL/FixJ family response regulator
MGDRTNVRVRTTVVIAANDLATRAGIRIALADGGVQVVDEVDSVHELIASVRRKRPDLCLVSVNLRGDGILAAAELAARAPSVAVVVLTQRENVDEFLEVMGVGAAGYLEATISASALVNVVQAVLNGEPAVPRSLVRALIDEHRERPIRRYVDSLGVGVQLTSRESEVLTCLREGLTTREIAQRLRIAEVTVRRHIGSALKKLGVESRSDALRLLQTA